MRYRVTAAWMAVFALAVAIAILPDRSARAGQYCYGKITASTPNSDAQLCNGLMVGDIVCVPCPAGRHCARNYECTRRRTVLSGVCQVVVETMADAQCQDCPGGTRARHGTLDPPKAWWRWGWSCREA